MYKKYHLRPSLIIIISHVICISRLPLIFHENNYSVQIEFVHNNITFNLQIIAHCIMVLIAWLVLMACFYAL